MGTMWEGTGSSKVHAPGRGPHTQKTQEIKKEINIETRGWGGGGGGVRALGATTTPKPHTNHCRAIRTGKGRGGEYLRCSESAPSFTACRSCRIRSSELWVFPALSTPHTHTAAAVAAPQQVTKWATRRREQPHGYPTTPALARYDGVVTAAHDRTWRVSE